MNIDLTPFNFTPEQSFEALEKILQFEYTKLEMEIDSRERLEKIRLEQEYKLAEIEYEYKFKALEYAPRMESSSRPSRITSKIESESNHSQEDIEFNNLTGFGHLQNKHIGKIAKTNLQSAIKTKFQEIESQIDFDEIKNLSSMDLNSTKIKSLFISLLMGSMSSIRLTRWPNAPDSDMIFSIKSEINDKLDEYDFNIIIYAVEFIKEYLDEEYNQTSIGQLDTTLFAEILDDAYIKQELQEEYKEDFDVNNSPVGKAINKTISHLDVSLRRDLVKMYLETNPKKGLDHMSGIVMLYSEKFPIPEFEDEYEDNWSEFYKNNKSRIDSYFFSKFLRDYNANKSAQIAWEEEKEKFLAELHST